MTVDKSRKTLVRARMAATGKPHTAAARDVEIITEIMAEQDCDYGEAEAELDDPRNELLCADCGWTMGMICPECAKGCGCEWRCSGWRHREWGGDPDGDDDDSAELGCIECGLLDECTC